MDGRGEEQNAVNKYPVGADVTLWCVKILWAIISVVPFYFITLQQSSVSAA